jgi:hypothetical protein
VSYEEIGRWILECWQAVMVTCVKNGFKKAFGDASTPEMEDHEEPISKMNSVMYQNRLQMHFINLIVIQMKILLVLGDLIVLFAYKE